MENAKKMILVAALTSSYGYGSPTEYFGPSTEPIEVPVGLAQALGLPEFDPNQVEQEQEPESVSSDIDVQDILDANEEMGAYIADIVTMTGAADSAAAKLAVADAIAKAGKVAELETVIKHGTSENQAQIHEIGNLRDALSAANAKVKELETLVSTANARIDESITKIDPSTDAEKAEVAAAIAQTTKKGK